MPITNGPSCFFTLCDFILLRLGTFSTSRIANILRSGIGASTSPSPFLKQDIDYAIIARFQDATSGGPVIVIAGISSNGTEAAGEFVVSPEQLNTLARIASQGSLDRNFEAVLKVEVVGGNTGATTIVVSQFW